MALQTFNFTTGPATLPDVGTLSYNGCLFSPLFFTQISGDVLKDNAGRTTKYMEYTLKADGYVTLPAGATSINGAMSTLRQLLTAQGGQLTYQGRGFDLVVNAVGGAGVVGAIRDGRVLDAAWGPVPTLLEFQPLGGGLSAKVQWTCKVRVMEFSNGGPLLQFNNETSVSYGEDGYSTISIRGTLEIPITRPTQATRRSTITVDNYRTEIETRIISGIDLSRFRVTNREFPVSRDKRTMEWSVTAVERSYMDVPPDCTIARGTYSFRPARTGMGLCLWLCTLRCTYTIRADRPRRVAWDSFLALLRLRMSQSQFGFIPRLDGDQNPGKGGAKRFLQPFPGVREVTDRLRRALQLQNKEVAVARKAFLIDFSGDEGVYLDSKTTSFSATWRLVTVFSHILLASGLWTKLPEEDAQGNNLWATSMKDVQGSQSWLPNKLDPKLDLIVDFGGG